MINRLLLSFGFTIGLLANSAAQTDTAGPVTISWYGQGCFSVTTTGGVSILIDPVGIKEYAVPDDVKPDIVTVSHNHRDHTAVETVSGEPIIFWGMTREESDPNQSLIPVDTVVNGVHLYNVSSNHHPVSESPALNAIFVFEFGDLRLVHLGDLGTTLNDDQIARIGRVDILMIPVGGKYTIFGATADTVVSQLQPSQIVIPMHFQTSIADFLPYSGADFVDGKPNVVRIPGNEYVLPQANTATEMQYVLFELFD